MSLDPGACLSSPKRAGVGKDVESGVRAPPWVSGLADIDPNSADVCFFYSIQDPATYRDQTDVFFDSPQDYIRKYFPEKVNPSFPPSPFPTSLPGTPTVLSDKSGKYPWAHEWPQYLIFFGALLEKGG